MLWHMRTTIRLDDALLKEVKRYALEHDTTFTAVVEEALKDKLAKATRKPFKLATHRGGGLQPGVDLSDNASLLDLMEGLSGREPETAATADKATNNTGAKDSVIRD